MCGQLFVCRSWCHILRSQTHRECITGGRWNVCIIVLHTALWIKRLFHWWNIETKEAAWRACKGQTHSSNHDVNTENVLITVERRQARMWVGERVTTLTIDIGNSSQARRERVPKVCFVLVEKGGICAGWKAVRAGRNSDVMGESRGVSVGVECLPLECAVCYCQASITQLFLFLYLSVTLNSWYF